MWLEAPPAKGVVGLNRRGVRIPPSEPRGRKEFTGGPFYEVEKWKKSENTLAFSRKLCYYISCVYETILHGERGEDTMKAGIHPDYQQTTIQCACGSSDRDWFHQAGHPC